MSDTLLNVDLYPFQAEGAALCALRKRNLAIWSTGIGKTLLAIGSSALMVDTNTIDAVLVIAEKSKVEDWSKDFARFANGKLASPVVYAGTPKKRESLCASEVPKAGVVVVSYDTARRDLVETKGKSKRAMRSLKPGPLMEALQNRRIFVVLDEVSARCSNRSSQTFKSIAYFLNRKMPTRALGLTATPLTRNPESIWNVAYLLDRDAAGPVADFQENYIAGLDLWGNPNGWKNLEGRCDPGVTSLKDLLAPLITNKSKFDADVVNQFPKMVEEPEWVAPSKDERALMGVVASMAEDESGLMTLRQCVAHPHALLSSEGALAKQVVEDFGEGRIRKMESTKENRLIEMLLSLGEQDQQSVVFTFFGQTVLKLLSARMTKEGIAHVVHHGQMNTEQRELAKQKFVDGEAAVFLSSDAGARGLNLPQATSVIQYEPPLTWADYEQRTNRHHRIDSTNASVNAVTMIARGTVEESIVGLVLARNRWTESLAGTASASGELTAEQRRQLIMRARKHR